MKKVKINGTEYDLDYGIDCIEFIGREIENDNLDKIIEAVIETSTGSISVSTLSKMALLLRAVVYAGSGSEIEQKEAKNWVYKNLISATKIYTHFISEIPKAEEEGNLTAPTKGAQPQTTLEN